MENKLCTQKCVEHIIFFLLPHFNSTNHTFSINKNHKYGVPFPSLIHIVMQSQSDKIELILFAENNSL